MMAEAMADAGVHGGLSRDYATKIAVQTILGAAQMAAQTEKHPAILKGNKKEISNLMIPKTGHYLESNFSI